MWGNIFNSIIRKRLLREYRKQKREVQIITLADAGSVGILWNPVDEESIETYEVLRKLLSERHIKSFGIAYIGSRREKETLSTVSNSWFINNGNTGIFGRPSSGEGIQFLQQEFDILIDLTLKKCLALQYILVHNQARFKVGFQAMDPNFYDLEIDVSANPSCRFLMDQIVHYLDKLTENK